MAIKSKKPTLDRLRKHRNVRYVVREIDNITKRIALTCESQPHIYTDQHETTNREKIGLFSMTQTLCGQRVFRCSAAGKQSLKPFSLDFFRHKSLRNRMRANCSEQKGDANYKYKGVHAQGILTGQRHRLNLNAIYSALCQAVATHY